MSAARHRFFAVLVVELAFVSGPLSAQPPAWAAAEDPVLASLVEEALARNPEVAAARQAAGAAAQRPAQARALPNPSVSVAYTNDGWAPSLGSQDMTTLAFMASQELPYPGKRSLRGELAAREAALGAQQAARVERGVTAAVKRAYYGLLLGRELLDVIHDQEETWKQIEGVARARYAVGQGAQQDVLRVQIEVTRVEGRRAEQEAEVAIRVAELNRLLARRSDAPLETPARLTLRPVQGEVDRLAQWAASVSPEIGAAGVDVERAALAVTLAKKDFKPDFSVQAGYMNRGGLPPMWQAGVGVSVPLYRKRLAAGLAEAEAVRSAAQSTAESLRLQLRFRTHERLTQLRTTERVATLYAEGIVPQDRMSVEAAVANYQTGQVPFITVLEALTTLYVDRAAHLRLLASHAQTLASLEEASVDSTAGMASVDAGGARAARTGGMGEASAPSMSAMGNR